MTRRNVEDWKFFAAVGGATVFGSWLLARHGYVAALNDDSGTVTIREPGSERTLFGVRFGRPLPYAVVAGGWGDPRPKHVGSYHYAIDLPAAIGTPIYAVTAGEVVHADQVGKSTAGKYVVVRNGDVHSRYLHMSVVEVRMGQRVLLGEEIGRVGSTGFSSAPHLHLDVFFADELLSAYRERFGTPTPGFPTKRRWGTQVPAEPLIPVDKYGKSVVAAAARRGVVLVGGAKPATPRFTPRPVARTYDRQFAKYGAEFRIPPAFLRALAKRESDLNRLETSGPAWGLMQIIEVVRRDFNKRHNTHHLRSALLRADVNVRIGASALRTIANSYARHHKNVVNMKEDWHNPRFVELLTFGWNTGWSEVAGVGRVVGFLTGQGHRDVTVDLVHKHATNAGAAKYLNNSRSVWWSKTVAQLYFSEQKHDDAQRSIS